MAPLSTQSPNCPSCGARVDAAQGEAAYVYTCRFCNARISIEPLQPVLPRGIPEIVRISVEANAASATARSEIATATKAAGKTIGCFVMLMTVLPLLIPAGIFLGPTAWNFINGNFGSFPMAVPMNGSMTISDRTETGTDTMVTVGVNGKLTLKNCHLTGPLIVKGEVNAEITVIDSTLTGQDGVIEGATNAVVTLKNSTLTSDGPAIALQENGHVAFTGGRVESKSEALRAGVNVEGTIRGSALVGPRAAYDVGPNAHLTLVQTTISGPKKSGANARIDLR